MKYPVLVFCIFISINFQVFSQANISIKNYHELVNKAELQIVSSNFPKAAELYKSAFDQIDLPFGKDLFNCALCYGKINNKKALLENLQALVDYMADLKKIESAFLNKYISEDEWNNLIAKRMVRYDENLRNEMLEINARDQLFRPDYDNYDDTINANRIFNLNRILELTAEYGFPSQREIGFADGLWHQPHYIVLHHTAQRRSRDKYILDLEPVLFQAVNTGRMEPDFAIQYMEYQNDQEKGRFETYNVWQIWHPLLPDSLNNKLFLPKLDNAQKEESNAIRSKWLACSIEDIATKAAYLNANPDEEFIFISVGKSIAMLRDDYDAEDAMKQYNLFRTMYEPY